MVNFTQSQVDAIAARNRPPAEREAIVAKKSAVAEKKLQEQIIAYLRVNGIFPMFNIFGRKSTFTPGAPDVICAINGQPFGFEVKTEKEKPSDEQLRVHEAMKANGWQVYVVRSVEDVQQVIRRNT